MQTSNNKQRALVLILTIVFFLIGIFLGKLMLTPATLTDMVNYHTKQIDAAGENVDMLFVGGSRTYRSFDPDIIDKELNIKNGLNNGSPAQRTIFSYYLLKEYLKKYDPKYVVIGSTYYGMMFEQAPDYMMYNIDRLSLKSQIEYAKVQYGLSQGLQAITGKALYLNNLWPAKMIENVKDKWKCAHGGSYLEEKIEMQPNGYKGEYKSLESGSVSYSYDTPKDVFREEDIDSKQLEYFDKMVQMCKERGIKVFLASGPCTISNIYRIDNYQGAVDFYKNYAEENGIYYYNLNYLKDREKYMPDELFIDRLHLNYEGGQYVSRMFAKIVKDEIAGKDTSHYFYKDLDDLKKHVHRIPSCACKLSYEDGMIRILADSTHNDDVKPQYRVLAYNGEEEGELKNLKVVKNWSYNNEWLINMDELRQYDFIRVQARIKNNNQPVAYDDGSLEKYKYENE